MSGEEFLGFSDAGEESDGDIGDDLDSCLDSHSEEKVSTSAFDMYGISTLVISLMICAGISMRPAWDEQK